ncbi:MAG: hypothetical protein E6Q73_10800 [Pseudorhodobacter sp.]|nr:MAG: hypothetical protein E6Q73_10800 [Pseudorhodobacter sp.]
MTIQLRHLSSLLRAKPKAPAFADVPGLAYYTAAETAVPPADASPARPEHQAIEAMYGYYSAQA